MFLKIPFIERDFFCDPIFSKRGIFLSLQYQTTKS